jgi:hypothetical protein
VDQEVLEIQASAWFRKENKLNDIYTNVDQAPAQAGGEATFFL